MGNKVQLDQLTLEIEFLLISVIQGVAVAALATASLGPIDKLDFQYWPYIFTGFLFILTFWSGAINHALSFIQWPVDLIHSFLYFLVSFVEVLALNQITSPLLWFGAVLVFQLTAAILYSYDLVLIKKCLKSIGKKTIRYQLYINVHKQQIKELYLFIPASIIFNLICFLLILWYPELFIEKGYHLILIGLQCIFVMIFLINLLTGFQKRSELIAKVI